MKYKTLPDVRRLRELFSYDADTGQIKWLVRRKGVNADMVAGVPGHGYVVIRVDGVLYQAHRLIWKFVTGDEPIDQIDHKDLDRLNNRWVNLRQADNNKNMMNAGLSSANTSGVKGVVWDHGSWSVRIKLNGKTHYFGRYKNLDDATKRMLIERDRLHGVFARVA